MAEHGHGGGDHGHDSHGGGGGGKLVETAKAINPIHIFTEIASETIGRKEVLEEAGELTMKAGAGAAMDVANIIPPFFGAEGGGGGHGGGGHGGGHGGH